MTECTYCAQEFATENPAEASYTVVVNAPRSGYSEMPACAEHANEKRGNVYVTEVREKVE